jgi:putative transposase
LKPISPVSPNLNAVAERWVQSVKHELLDHFIVFGEAHLRHLLSQFETYYNQCRPHQSMDNRPPNWKPPPGEGSVLSLDIACEKRLGGLLKHYHRRAA